MLHKLLTILVGVMLASTVASATPINGSVSILALSATLSGGSNLMTATQITPNFEFFGTGFGDFSAIASFTPITGSLLTLSNLNAFSWTNSTIGTWTTTSSTILTQTASNLDIYLLGNFTPSLSGVLAGFDPNSSSELISLNQSGLSVSWSATLSSPPTSIAAVAEPGTIALFGVGLFGLVVFGKHRMQTALTA